MSNITSISGSIARLSLRDIQYPLSVDQVYLPGIDLSEALFKPRGYTNSTIDMVYDVLRKGFARLFLDLFYNERTRHWQLCPQYFPVNASSDTALHNLTTASGKHVQCSSDSNIPRFVENVMRFINDTDTNIEVSLIIFSLRLRLLAEDNSTSSMNLNSLELPKLPLEEVFRDTVAQSRLFQPSQLASLREGTSNSLTAMGTDRTHRSTMWPSSHELLVSLKKRVIVTYDDGGVPEANRLIDLGFKSFAFDIHGKSNIFDQNGTQHNFPTTLNEYKMAAEVSFRYISLSNHDSLFADWEAAVGSGSSPVLNTTYRESEAKELFKYTPLWALGEPKPQTFKDRDRMLESGVLTTCVLESNDGFLVGNCHDKHSVLCQNSRKTFDWIYTDRTHSSFDADCPSGYKWKPPRSGLESRRSRNLLGPQTAWIDINSYSLPNCWTSGGPRAVCPYNIIEGNRNGVGLLVAACVVAVVLLVSCILLDYRITRMPLRPRKSTKDKIFEGIAL